MPTTRLSPKQLDVLRRLAEPGAKAAFSPSQGCWFLSDLTTTKEIKSLLLLGLVDAWSQGFIFTATINDAGRAALSP